MPALEDVPGPFRGRRERSDLRSCHAWRSRQPRRDAQHAGGEDGVQRFDPTRQPREVCVIARPAPAHDRVGHDVGDQDGRGSRARVAMRDPRLLVGDVQPLLVVVGEK
jgi:hypothetical protein